MKPREDPENKQKEGKGARKERQQGQRKTKQEVYQNFATNVWRNIPEKKEAIEGELESSLCFLGSSRLLVQLPRGLAGKFGRNSQDLKEELGVGTCDVTEL